MHMVYNVYMFYNVCMANTLLIHILQKAITPTTPLQAAWWKKVVWGKGAALSQGRRSATVLLH